MRLETFFEKFELFAEAPGAMRRMRELILQLAVQGKLVAQDELDEPASALLKMAAAQRAMLTAAKKIKTRKNQPVERNEQPFYLPQGWAWARLSDIGYELGQKVPDNRFTYIDVGSIDSDKGRISDRVEMLEPGEAPSRARKLVARGTVIYSTVRPYLLNIAVIDQNFDPEPIASTAFGILHPFESINNRYLFYWLRSTPFTAYVQASMKGMAYPAINDENFYNGLIAIPPIAEQKRIVAKVDELMALCDRLEAQQQEREAQRAKLVGASLARFSEAPTPANLSSLFHPSYNITPVDLRKSILTLAVQGKLVPQDHNDEPAQKLLSIITKQRAKLVSSDLLRKNKLCRQFTSDEAPNRIPATWAWTMLGEITDIGTGSTPSRTEAFFWIDGTIPWITSGSTSRSPITEEDELVTPAAVKAHRLRIYPPGTLLVALYGQGKTRGQVATLEIPATINQACAAICPLNGIPPMQSYLKLLLEKQYDEMRSFSAGGAQPNLNVQKIKELFVPLPPFAEQRRIVTKVDELMALVDQLEAQFAKAKSASTALLNAAIYKLLNPSSEIITFPVAQAIIDRAGIGCYIVQKLAGHKTFGRVALMKHEYFAEAHIGATLDGHYRRQAAGPLDSWVYRFEEDAAREGWFTVEETKTRDGHKKIIYRKGAGLDAKASVAFAALPQAQRDELDRVLALLGGKPTEEVEIIATLFAVWNDFLIDGHSPSDEDIVTGFREHWHKNKQKFTAKSLHIWLDWMRRNGIVPTGRGPRTQQHPKLDLH